MMSRFRPDSELSRLNGAGAIDASPDLAEVVGLALAAASARPEASTRPSTTRSSPPATTAPSTISRRRTAATRPRRAAAASSVDGRRITLDPGVRLDLGGIGKGFAAERAPSCSRARPCLVSAGGDVAVRGVPADGTGPVAVDETLTLGLDRGGLATSGSDRRRWRRGGDEQHHLIDPATGRPRDRPPPRDGDRQPMPSTPRCSRRSLFLGGAAEAIAADVPAVIV